MKIGFISLGCAKNLVDSEYLIGLLDDPFFEIESNPNKCDAIIINTCAFIESAREEAINTIIEIGELKQKNLQYLIVTGCLAQRYYQECIDELNEVDLFVRIDQYGEIDKLLSQLFKHEIKSSYGKTRKLINNNYSAYLKIGDGCNNCCTYCAIPLIRGKYHSYPEKEIIDEAKRLYSLGVKELNVVAQDTTTYGKDIGTSLANLLKKLDEIDFKWIRVLYMYPDEIDEDLLQTIKNSKHILPYFDIPIQYGNDKILKLMNRRGTVQEIKACIKRIRELMPGAIIRTTMIVGFPYEDDESFKDTLDFIEDIRFDSLGAYTYSKEEDTKAYDMPQIPEELAKKRYDEMMLLQQKIAFEKNAERIGQKLTVLIERHEGLFNRYVGRSMLSAPDGIDGVVYIKTDKQLHNGDFVDVEIIDYKDYDLIGKIV